MKYKDIKSYPDPYARHPEEDEGDKNWAEVYDKATKPIIEITDSIVKLDGGGGLIDSRNK